MRPCSYMSAMIRGSSLYIFQLSLVQSCQKVLRCFYQPCVYATFQISTNGILSFENSYPTFSLCSPMPCAPEVIIAPVWTDLDFRESGVMFYRSSKDSVILGQIASTIAEVNPGLSDYQPTEAVVFTWFEARAHFDDVSFFSDA